MVDSPVFFVLSFFCVFVILFFFLPNLSHAAEAGWTSANHYRILLTVDPHRVKRSNSPASVDLDLAKALADAGGKGQVDQTTVEVVTFDSSGQPRVFDRSRPKDEQYLLPCRVDPYFGTTNVTVSFVVPDEKCTHYTVYFDTLESGLGKPKRYPGLIGDGDYFRVGYERREINASRFDCFCDFDGDGDLDLFKGGVEPFVYCYENVGRNHLVERGKLTSAGKVLAMPHYDNGRGWMTVAFCDWDDDGDQDLFADMGDSPQAGQILIYENTTARGGQLTFTERGSLKTQQDKQIGGRFVAITFVDWDADGKKDIVSAGYESPMFFRNVGSEKSLEHLQLAEGVPILAEGKKFPFVASKVDPVDVDDDGDLDLFAANGGGPIYLFKNTGTRTAPVLGPGVGVAYDASFLIGDAHTGVKAADFDGDGLIDFVGGRFWERTPLAQAAQPRYFGGLFRNAGKAKSPKFKATDATHGSPYTEQFQICDAVRQNVVRGVDWDSDGKNDLIAGDTDGYVWYFRNETDHLFPVFATGQKLRAGGEMISRYKNGGHARPDITDWNNDGKQDLIIADGGGQVTLYLNTGAKNKPVLAAGRTIEADGRPISSQAGRASLAVCDWDNDGKKDLIYADQERHAGYHFFRNTGTDAQPVFAAAKPIMFGKERATYVRPNLGSYVDWDGDGKKDFIGCQFEERIRLYRNIGSGGPGEEPRFTDPDGTVIVQPFCVQLVSGADAKDFNGDGDLDILTGQGHGGSGLCFFERDYIQDLLNKTRPIVTVGAAQRR